MEKVILIGVCLKNEFALSHSLEELARLANTAGANVHRVYQVRVQNFNAATLIGTGKLQEIAAECAAEKIDSVIFDEEISPAQQKNLEEILPAKVLDRTRLILDIFAQRARTQEGKLQVELAQLNYLLPRLSGRGSAMMQQKGGIGMRGPGERKLEYDRRRLRARISRLEQEIEQVKKERSLRREKRQRVPLPQIALIGYTNAGKSTLLNALTQEKAVYADDKLFATLDPTTRRVPMKGGGQMLFTDTVGFIQKLPHSLVSAFRATLEETAFADVLLHIHDASSPQREEQARVVHKIVTDLHAAELPIIDVFNKADLLSEVQLQLLKNQYPSALFISAEKQKGLSALLTAVEKALKIKWKVRPLRISAKQADLLGQIYTRSLVLSRTPTNDGGLELKIMATDGNYAELRKKTSAN
ncbi:MAG: GTPase HflX [Elusimicrobiaceae bacterium]|nr:GTPase HflX [Elusimicrobiaceae bacterium]